MESRGKFGMKITRYITVIMSVISAIILTIAGGFTEGWFGVFLIFSGQAVLIILLYIYNRRYK